ncbi:aminopeptidase [Candidatus Undinarchaeota archaeon]
MGTLQKGAYNAVNVCMGIKKGETVTLITDDSAREIADALRIEAEKTDAEVHFLNLDDYGNRRESKKNLLKKAPRELLKVLKASDVTFYNASSKSFSGITEVDMRIQIINYVTEHARHAHMPGVTVQMMEQGMCVDYKKVHQTTHKVYDDYLKDTKKMHIRSRSGTDLLVEFGPTKKYPNVHWYLCDGIYHKKGQMGNLPEGEVFTCPVNANGRLVIDGCIGELCDEDLEKNNKVLSMDIESGFCDMNSINCDEKDLLRKYKAYLSQHPNSSRVGELGVGTNLFIRDFGLIGEMLQDEKYPGIHIAFGDSGKDETGLSWEKEGGDPPSHIDGVIKNATVDVFDKNCKKKRLLKNGKFTFE